jgi:hypothetical protein
MCLAKLTMLGKEALEPFFVELLPDYVKLLFVFNLSNKSA